MKTISKFLIAIIIIFTSTTDYIFSQTNSADKLSINLANRRLEKIQIPSTSLANTSLKNISKTKNEFSSDIQTEIKNTNSQLHKGKTTKKGFTFDYGLASIITPEYEGSDRYDVNFYPYFDLRWRNFFFDRNGIGANIFDKFGVKTSATLNYDFGRDADDSAHLEGLEDIDGGIIACLRLEKRFDKFFIRSDLKRQLSGADTGFQLDANVGWRFSFGRRGFLRAFTKASFVEDDYIQEYFGISTLQSMSSGLPEYKSNGNFVGIKSVGFGVFALRNFKKNYSAIINISYDYLLDDAGDSPLTKEKNQLRLIIGLTRRF